MRHDKQLGSKRVRVRTSAGPLSTESGRSDFLRGVVPKPRQPSLTSLDRAVELCRPYGTALCLLWLTVPSSVGKSLQPWALKQLPLGSIQPRGWLQNEMEALADGLSGHLHDFWVFVSSSVWLYPGGAGGVDYSDSNEALPYWFNGMVPLAYQLDNQALKDQVHAVASTVLDLQQGDGWLGPESAGNRDFWGRIPFLLGLTQLVEANSTWEQPIVGAVRKFMSLANAMLKDNGTGLTNCPGCDANQWGQMRIADLIITIQWLLENRPSTDQDALLWDNMQMLYDLNPRKWKDYYVQGRYQAVVKDAPFMFTHGVNVGQGLKQSAVYERFLNDSSLTQATMDAVEWTFRDHGAASGTIIADEAEQGLAPWSGSELCTAVETGYSLTYLYQAMGVNEFADRAERVIYNAMPAMLTGDKWAHQYMIQGNQPWANNNTQDFEQGVPHVFTTANSGLATVYGMEPQYPCCTANHPQGYPKLLSNSWVAVGSTGLGHALLGPSSVSTTVGGAQVSVTCDTNYPFTNTLTYTVSADAAFDLYLRVPEWAESSSSVTVESGASSPLSPGSNGMHKVSLQSGQSTVSYKLGAAIRTESRSNNTVAVYYGALHYALEITTNVSSSYPHAYGTPTGPGLDYLPYPQLRDYYLIPSSPWGITIDVSTLTYHGMPSGSTLPDLVFDTNVAPAYITFQGCQIIWPRYLDIDTTPDWAPADRTCFDEVAEYRLIPFGAAKLHMSDLPVKPV